MAQQSRLLSLSDYTYDYINRMQKRGKMLDLNPTQLPYSYGEVKASLAGLSENRLTAHEKVWVDLIKDRVNYSEAGVKKSMGVELNVATRLSDTKRQNVLNPLNNNVYVYPYPSLTGYMEKDNFVGQIHVRHDFYYDQEPDGLDAGRRLYNRSEDSYVGYNGEGVRFLLGRFQHQWGRYGEASSVISTNALAFDQLNIGLKGKYFSFNSVLGELDGLSNNGTFTGRSVGADAKDRYVAMHRINWEPSRYFGMSFFETVVYSGYNSGFSLKYANPLLVFGFVTDNKPKNDENNLMLGGMMWGHHQNFSFNGQLLLDDLEHTNNVGEPITFTFLSSFNYAMSNPAIDLNLEFEAVAYQTYNTDQAEGRYLYLGRGIATQNNDYMKLKLYPDIYLDQYAQGLKVSPYVSWYAQGEQVINQEFNRRNPDGSVIDVILSGQEEETIRGGVHVLYQPISEVWFELDSGYNSLSNKNHIAGLSESRWVTIARVGVRLALYGD